MEEGKESYWKKYNGRSNKEIQKSKGAVWRDGKERQRKIQDEKLTRRFIRKGEHKRRKQRPANRI